LFLSEFLILKFKNKGLKKKKKKKKKFFFINIISIVEMEENFTSINTVQVKRKMTKEYFPIWSPKIELALSIKGLLSYIYYENIKMNKKNDPHYSKGCIKVIGTTDLYYSSNVTEEMIVNDGKVKYIIKTNLSDEDNATFDYMKNTSYQIWKILKGTYLKGVEERKILLKKELERTRYDSNGDFEIHLNNMINMFNKLKDLDDEVNDEEKFRYLYNSLPQDLINASGMMMYFGKWEECCEHLKVVIPKLKFFNQYKNIQSNSCCCECATHRRTSKQSKNFNNIKCYRCGRLGHMARDCRSRVSGRYNKYNHSHNYTTKNNKNYGNYGNNNYTSHNNNHNNNSSRNYDNNDNDRKRKFDKNVQANNVELPQMEANAVEVTQIEDNYNNILDNQFNIDYNDDNYNECNIATATDTSGIRNENF